MASSNAPSENTERRRLLLGCAFDASFDASLDAISAAFEARRTRLAEACLLLLRDGLLLLLPLLCSSGILPAALTACGNRSHRRTGAGIAAKGATDKRTTRCTPYSRARGCSRCCRRRLCRRLRWRRFRGIETALLDGPGMAARLVTFLLLWLLPLGRINILLRPRLGHQGD